MADPVSGCSRGITGDSNYILSTLLVADRKAAQKRAPIFAYEVAIGQATDMSIAKDYLAARRAQVVWSPFLRDPEPASSGRRA